jgi:hypothetical protein
MPLLQIKVARFHLLPTITHDRPAPKSRQTQKSGVFATGI